MDRLPSAPLDPKQFYRRIETVLAGLPGGSSPTRRAAALAPRVLEQLGEGLGLASAQLYAHRSSEVRLVESWGEACPTLAADLIPLLHPDGASDGAIELPWTG